MTITFTDTELKYIVLNPKNSSYGLAPRKNTPRKIKKSIDKKIHYHKLWLAGKEVN